MVRNYFESVGPESGCECSTAAKSQQGALLARLHANDTSGLEELLKFYSGCIDGWGSILYTHKADHVVFRAELVAHLLANAASLTEENFSTKIHLFAREVAAQQHQKIIEWNQRDRKIPSAKETLNNSPGCVLDVSPV